MSLTFMGPLDPPFTAVREAVSRALTEDLTPLGDLTSVVLDPAALPEARFVAREPGRLAGTACAHETFAQVDPGIDVRWSAADGDEVTPAQELAVVRGRLVSVLVAERTALNFLGHLSGIATLTAAYVDAA